MTQVPEVCRTIDMGVMRLLKGIRRRAGQFATEPGPGDTPITLDGLGRNAQNLRGFLHGQTAEVAELYDLRLPRVQLRQPLQGVIQFLPALRFRGTDGRHIFIQRYALLIVAATFVALAPTSIVDQDLPHQVGGDSNESAAILPISLLLRNQPEVDFVNQGSGLQGVAITLLAEVVMC